MLALSQVHIEPLLYVWWNISLERMAGWIPLSLTLAAHVRSLGGEWVNHYY